MTLRIRLFGEFRIENGAGNSVGVLENRKAGELFCYLLLNHERSHPREMIAEILWGEQASTRAKKYLRHALWQLQTTLEAIGVSPLRVDAGWLRIDPRADLWLDVRAFERAFRLARGVSPEALTKAQVGALQDAVDLYRGDLLLQKDWSWCFHERERLQSIYLSMLDQLMAHAETVGDYERGLRYGERALQSDGARESTHRKMMRLYSRKRDRTSALRQYQRCVIALAEEFDVKPSRRTTRLYERIRNDNLSVGRREGVFGIEPKSSLPDMLLRLQRLDSALDTLHIQVQREIRALQTTLQQQE